MREFRLSEIADILRGKLEGDALVSSIVLDSREAKAGSLFAAVSGSSQKGDIFLSDARNRGAVAAIVADRGVLDGFPGIVVPDVRSAVSRAAAHFAGYPSKSLTLIGITGTNGKSTITWILYHLFLRAGFKAGRIGTLGVGSPDSERELALTTPDAVYLQNTLASFLKEGVTHGVMEVSSHALDQKRSADLEFDAAIFTNLTHDHLDYHGDLESYFKSKLELFNLLGLSGKGSRVGVANCDDPYGKVCRARIKELDLQDSSFSFNEDTPVKVISFTEQHGVSKIKLRFAARDFDLCSPLIGRHNVENVAAAFAVWVGLCLDPQLFVNALAEVPQVPGRLERIVAGAGQEFSVYVDYAHSPDALERVLSALRPSTPGRLTVVFGCGGDRDRAKRKVMGEVSVRLADRVVVTSDNPRTEDPNSIIEDILEGTGGKTLTVIPDRRAAIQEAIFHSSRGDTVLIAGKGHENYQVIGKERFAFSDQEEARRVLNELFPKSS